MKIRSAALTDIGKVRLQNQDHVLCQPALGLFGVADGVGGLPGGAEASECAIRSLTNAVRAAGEGEVDLRAVLETANVAVGRLGALVSPEIGIGTTVTLGLFRAGRARLAHVGDSRAYLLRAGEIAPMTEDHTVEVEARRRNTPGDYLLLHPQSKHTLTRCVGQPGPVETDIVERDVAAGDRWLFVTDGVTRLLTDPELAEILGRAAEPAEALRVIVDLALERGGHDNITAVVVFVDSATG